MRLSGCLGLLLEWRVFGLFRLLGVFEVSGFQGLSGSVEGCIANSGWLAGSGAQGLEVLGGSSFEICGLRCRCRRP